MDTKWHYCFVTEDLHVLGDSEIRVKYSHAFLFHLAQNEYKNVNILQVLGELGLLGWELVTAHFGSNGYNTFVMKHPA